MHDPPLTLVQSLIAANPGEVLLILNNFIAQLFGYMFDCMVIHKMDMDDSNDNVIICLMILYFYCRCTNYKEQVWDATTTHGDS